MIMWRKPFEIYLNLINFFIWNLFQSPSNIHQMAEESNNILNFDDEDDFPEYANEQNKQLNEIVHISLSYLRSKRREGW